MGLIRNRQGASRRYSVVGLAFILVLLFGFVASSAIAATVIDDQTYHLESGEVLQDDLIIMAQTVTIDGKIEGDLIAMGQTIIVNGEVTEDVIAAGAEVIINGTVGDDVLIAGMRAMVEGDVGDDVLAAGGPAIPGTGPVSVPIEGRTIQGGVGSGSASTIGGDGYFAGGFASIKGAYQGDLAIGAEQALFDATVQGNVKMEVNSVNFGDSAYIQGDLTYTTQRETGTPEAGGEVTKTLDTQVSRPIPEKEQHPIRSFGWWLLRTLLIIVGIAIVGALTLAFAPKCLENTVNRLSKKAVHAFLYGLLAFFAYVPLSAALTFLAWLFFGWFWGGVATFVFLFGLFILTWVFSPLVPGLWLGRAILNKTGIHQGSLWALVIGVTIIVLVSRILGQIPCAGGLINMLLYLVLFSLTVGSGILSMTKSSADEPLAVTAVEEVDAVVVDEPNDETEPESEDDSQQKPAE